MNLPNQLTMARCALTAVFVALMSFEHTAAYLAAYIVFTAAAITDYYDGKIARRDNLITNFGKLMDPVADKILMVAAFIMLMGVRELHIPGWTVVAILAREFLMRRPLAAAFAAALTAALVLLAGLGPAGSAAAAGKRPLLVLAGPPASVSTPLIHMVESGALNEISQRWLHAALPGDL